MGTTGWIKGQVRFFVGCASLAALGTGTAVAADLHDGVAEPVFAVRIAHEATADTVRRVLTGAHDRLAEPRCQQVFSEFHDQSGKPLQDTLDTLGHTGQSYLGLVIFYDGSRRPLCGKRGIMAVAVPGSRIVWVCPDEFRARARRNQFQAEATLIHEALHTLGLGENPTTSQEISSRVVAQCRH